MLDLGWFRILGLFGLMFDFFWDHFGFPGPDCILGNLVFLGFHVGSSGAPFSKPGDDERSFLRVLGSLWASFLVTFGILRFLGTLKAPLSAPKAAWIDFGSDFGSQMGGQGRPNASQNRTKNR